MTIALPAQGHITHETWNQCSAEGCILRYRALGLCDTHYRQARRREAAVAEWKAMAAPPRRQRVNRGGIVRWEVIK